MKKLFIGIFLLTVQMNLTAQVMTPEMLFQLNKISVNGVSKDGKEVIYTVGKYNIETNKKTSTFYKLPILGGPAIEIDDIENLIKDPSISYDEKYQICSKEVKIKPVTGRDFYPQILHSNVYIYDNLNYRHWDEWEDGLFGHVFLKNLFADSQQDIDIMMDEPYDCPQKPFGGAEDYIWNNDGTKIIYVTKKQYGTDYAVSTNTDIYSYDLLTKNTTNLTKNNLGYDTDPSFSKDGTMAWLQMDEPGNEADKNDIVILQNGIKTNLTKHWDGTVNSFKWSNSTNEIFFNAPINGTVQIFKVNIPKKGAPEVKQITRGQFDITSIVAQLGTILIVTRTDMNHATELFSLDLKTGKMNQVSHVNDSIYAQIKLSKVVQRMVPTTDGKEMLAWVIYPPDFDPEKKYPTLLYCQGGPQSALSQFYSVRWNFQLMAANGYIIIAPNRRGMPGFGVEWNEQISGDWGGQNMRDYLSAIDDICQETYVDKDRLGCVGASYGGYSAFFLAGIHENRFKSFIAHDGVFNTRSMYGTTEEVFFSNKDFGGAYWDNPETKTYTDFNPITNVDKWNTPILIIQGGKDFRISIGQGMEAFQAAQLKGIKSKFLYFPEENHWILDPQNGLVWQKEFFNWLKETIK